MNESLFQTVFEQASEGIVLIDGASRYLLEANKAFVELLGYPEELMFSMTLNDFVDLSAVGIERLYDQVLIRNEPYIGEVKCRRSDSTLIDAELRLNLLHFGGKELFCAFIRDVTMYRHVEKGLLETGGRFRQAVFSAPLPIMIHSEDGAVVMINGEWTRRTGYSFRDIPTIDDWVEKAFGAERASVLEKLGFLHKTGTSCTYDDLPVTTRSGEKLAWNLCSAPAGSLPDERRLFITMATDVTASKRVENDLKSSIHEKETMLREVHHRAKNNMQVIMSLLNLQSRYLNNPEAQEFFKESQERVRAMVLIHEMLCNSSNEARIDFNEYGRSLVGGLISAYSPNQSNLQVEMRISRVMVSLETAVPCGLIIHELVSNSLKHGFPDVRSGTITIDFDRDEAGLYTLVVGDNGIGLSNGLDRNMPGTLGLSLVNTLAKQLQGVVEFTCTSGTVCKITFRE
ncbi:MAG: histidine kinase dimerization/phosphoacceptor domain -containing protein [Oryzomonas sp.]|uniref:sensor histidine kinase n=1 Tax=Oryzomonas sp. TaxID=2855186 RepID=UPI002852277A|nr:histidine kinase dimerization/phosphoacceptor domain -containing protein [Oryzomonas sp.]MDR3579989.1 histidine kinase dimerization/phosphoacceptor domain -containing protein [Oryzomonas sp.]